ncbi:MAG TPA: cytochrome C biogenesis protein [Gammaproteobacteria bacterium]|jgi:thiol-disulfide isomerase/thioredoxin|nr:cytochrome C biogenesis protein [Gammaproteobacteria bacterium]
MRVTRVTHAGGQQSRRWFAPASRLALVLWVLLLASPSAWAYKQGDTVDPAILEKLALDPEKISVVDFFASWCVSCRKELPLLNAMTLDADTVELVGVSTDEELEQGLAFQQALDLRFRVYNDTAQEVVAAFAPIGMPALYYVQHGKVLGVHLGAVAKIDRVVTEDIARIQRQQP